MASGPEAGKNCVAGRGWVTCSGGQIPETGHGSQAHVVRVDTAVIVHYRPRGSGLVNNFSFRQSRGRGLHPARYLWEILNEYEDESAGSGAPWSRWLCG